MTLLFFTRLALYFLAALTPVLHPAVVVPYDTTSWWLWFFLVPSEVCVAYFLSSPRFKNRVSIYTGGVILLLTALAVGGFTAASFTMLLAGVLAWVLTFLVFRGRELGRTVAVFEQFFLVFIYYRVLNFGRASEEIAAASSVANQLLLVLIIITFLIHAIVLYRVAFDTERKGRRRIETLVITGVVIPLVFLFTFILPSDFVNHSVVLNNLYPDKKPETIYPTEEGKGWEESDWGSLDPRRGQAGEGDEAEGGRQGRLQGIPSDQWGSQSGSFGSGGKQYTVMVVASEREPVYAAERYYSNLDPLEGFTRDGEEELNSLSYQRLLETWQNRAEPEDRLRNPVEVAFISTLQERFVPYMPHLIEPTILKPEIFPFEYFYRVTSLLSFSSERDWKKIDMKTPAELEEVYGLEQAEMYLEVPMSPENRAVFQKHLDLALEGAEGYGQKIEAILRYFSAYQYLLGFTDDVSLQRIEGFLDISKSGDCTEFSNTAAILGRMAGIPSRVVTGYLAAKGLQSPAHRQGIKQLRESLEILQGYPEKDLYLVTTSHLHSWVQFYFPGYGWVDVEATAYAIPPPPGFDPNARDVVIPLIRDNRISQIAFSFPWEVILKMAGIILAGIIAFLYLYRYGREGYLMNQTRRFSPKAVKSLYLLLLMKCAARGYGLKEPSKTAEEYAEDYPELADFARLYTRLRYRTGSAEQNEKEWDQLKKLYDGVVGEGGAVRQEGKPLRTAFSLRGLYY